jgi:hypothetical protein
MWMPPGHYYSPVPSAADAQRAISGRRRIVEGVQLNEQVQLSLVQGLAPMWSQTPRDNRYIPDKAAGMYPLSDAAVYSSILRNFRPRHVLEIGSGFSSAVALDTVGRWDLDTRFTFVEPYPARLLGLLTASDHRTTSLRREPVQETPMAFFEELSADDILFVDSTHVAKSGSDVVHLVLDVLPRLAAGVIIHFHDVFWPFEYPDQLLQQRRGWNEDYLLQAFLAFNNEFQILLFNDWLWQEHPEIPMQHLPETADQRPGGLWIRRVS